MAASQNAAACLVSVMLMLSPLALADAKPAVFWVSDPVRPGEAVLVTGDGFGSASAVVLEQLTHQGQQHTWKVPPLQAGPTSLKFLLPDDLDPSRPLIGEIRTDAGTAHFELNAPTIYWTQLITDGESARRVLRVFGRCIALEGASLKLRLTDKSGAAILTSIADQQNLWSASFSLPPLPPGMYSAELVAYPGWPALPMRSILLKAATATKRSTISPVDYGAKGDGQADDTASIEQALNAAKQTGGADVLIPAGTYKVSRGLRIPDGVALKGDSKDTAMLFWPEFEVPPRALVECGNECAISALSLYATNYIHFLVNDTASGPTQTVFTDLVIRADPFMGHLTEMKASERLSTQQRVAFGGGDLIRLKGQGVTLRRVDAVAGGRSLALLGVTNAVVADSRFANGRWGWYSLSGVDGVIFEHNEVLGADLMSSGGGINVLGGFSAVRNVYLAANTFHSFFGWDRESVTSDGGSGFFYGAVTVDGRDLKLSHAIEGSAAISPAWVGAGVFVLSGKGQGQVRRVTAVRPERSELELDQSFIREPDDRSVVTIVPLQENIIFFGNTFADAGIGIQYYGTSLNNVAAANISIRTAGFKSSGRWYRHYQPSWYNQFIGNRIEVAPFYRGGSNNAILAGTGSIVAEGVQRAPNTAPLSLGAILRRNELGSQGRVRVGGGDVSGSPGLVDAIVEVNSGELDQVLVEGVTDRVLIRRTSQ